MVSLRLTASQVRFPARCATCGATPVRHITLESSRIVATRASVDQKTCQVMMPACAPCWAARLRRRVLWFLALGFSLALLMALAIGVGDTLGKDARGIMAVVLIVAVVAGIGLIRIREQEAFQRVLSPICLRRYDPRAGLVDLCFRDAALADDVALLSGLRDQAQVAATYREPAAAPLPKAWDGPTKRPLPWWSALVIGVMMFVVGAVEFVQLVRFETGRSYSTHFMIVLIYKLGGKYTVLGLFVFAGLAVCTGAFVWRAWQSRSS
jgi:hypothetical protein